MVRNAAAVALLLRKAALGNGFSKEPEHPVASLRDVDELGISLLTPCFVWWAILGSNQ